MVLRLQQFLLLGSLAAIAAMATPGGAAPPPPPINDECTTPIIVTGVPFFDIADVQHATTSMLDPEQSCGSSSFPKNNGSVWYQFTATTDDVIVVETFDSTYDTVLSVSTGGCGTPVEIACDDDMAAGLHSQVAFDVEAGQLYRIEITAYGDSAPAELSFRAYARGRKIAKAVDTCQRAIKKAGAKYAAKRTAILQACTKGLFGCVQRKPGDDVCRAKAAGKCAKRLAKIGKEEAKLHDPIVKKCALVEPPNLLDPSGLGFDRRMLDCEKGFGVVLTDDPATVAECVTRHHACRTERLHTTQEPRAGELFRLAGFDLGADLAGCLTDFGGAGADVGDPKGLGKDLDTCQRTGRKVFAKFAAKRLAGLEKCVDAVFTCTQRKAGDTRCYDRATAKCEKAIEKIGRETDKIAPSIGKKCEDINFDVALAPEGANVVELTALCAFYDVGALNDPFDYLTCATRHHTCVADEMLRYQAPRADVLLELIDMDPFEDFCTP